MLCLREMLCRPTCQMADRSTIHMSSDKLYISLYELLPVFLVLWGLFAKVKRPHLLDYVLFNCRLRPTINVWWWWWWWHDEWGCPWTPVIYSILYDILVVWCRIIPVISYLEILVRVTQDQWKWHHSLAGIPQ